MISDFIKTKDMPEEIIKRYGSLIPTEIVDIWKEYGMGSFLNGYMRIINPDEYLTFLPFFYLKMSIHAFK